jgi:hypothetical protein
MTREFLLANFHLTRVTRIFEKSVFTEIAL